MCVFVRACIRAYVYVYMPAYMVFVYDLHNALITFSSTCPSVDLNLVFFELYVILKVCFLNM